jgi:hypothetical protein
VESSALNPILRRDKPRAVIDENAFGALISYLAIEDDEYQFEGTETFRSRSGQFRSACLEALAAAPPARNTHALFLGHALYVEFPEAEDKPSLVSFVRSLRDRLREQEIATAGIVTYGGRWVETEDLAQISLTHGEGYKLAEVSMPSEPLRKALLVEAACHGVSGAEGWGAGLYFDAEVLEPLGLNLKNQPTPLVAGDGTYFRVGR